MDKLVEPMMEHVCDSLCRHPAEAPDQETLDKICAECEMGKHRCGILNEYNRINKFQGSQCEKLLEELGRERQKNRWIPVAERLPEKTGDYWVAMRHLDGSISTEKMFWSPEWPYEDAWREVVVAWQAYYYPEPFVPQN